MKFMIMVRANQQTEADAKPEEGLIAEMATFHEELAKAGALVDAAGLQPSSKGWRIRYSGKKRSVVDGPYTETKELIAGFWLIQVKSLDEAIEWVRRCPNPMESDSDIEIRQVFEPEDFGAEFTPELREQEARIMAKASANAT